MKLTFTLSLALFLGVAASVGCSSMPKAGSIELPLLSTKQDKKKIPVETKDEDIEIGDPQSMAVVWTDSIYSVGAKPTRGFGGRFFFYDEDGETINVDGELTIYGFDDSDDMQQRKVADRKYIFRPTELQEHASTNHLGTSYSFWVPWDDVGGERTTISLMPVFKTAEGRIVRGEMSVNVLPGKLPEEVRAKVAAGSKVPFADPSMFDTRQANFVERVNRGHSLVEEESQNRTSLKTTTIEVPRDLGQHLQTPQATRPQTPSPSSVEIARQAMVRRMAQQQGTTNGNVEVGVGPAPGFGTMHQPRRSPQTKSSGQ